MALFRLVQAPRELKPLTWAAGLDLPGNWTFPFVLLQDLVSRQPSSPCSRSKRIRPGYSHPLPRRFSPAPVVSDNDRAADRRFALRVMATPPGKDSPFLRQRTGARHHSSPPPFPFPFSSAPFVQAENLPPFCWNHRAHWYSLVASTNRSKSIPERRIRRRPRRRKRAERLRSR